MFIQETGETIRLKDSEPSPIVILSEAKNQPRLA
jgi:hypothetical protein